MKVDGSERQLPAIRQYAAANYFKLVRIFRADGVSGTRETTDGSTWAEMMVTLHSNGVCTIIIEQLDRIARDLIVQEAAIADLHKDGFSLVSVAEPDLMANG